MVGQKRLKPPGVRIVAGRYYRVIYAGMVDGKRKQRVVALSKVSDGLSELYSALARLEAKPKQDLRMSHRLTEWLKQALPGLSASEQNEQARMTHVIAHAFVEFKSDQVQAKHLLQFLQQFSGKEKFRTAQRYRNVLNKFFKWTILQGDRTDNPVQPVSTKAPPAHTRYVTNAEFLAIRSKLDDMPQMYVDLLYLTGQSGHEIRTLKWSQVADKVIKFQRSKVAKVANPNVDIPITAAIQTVLDRAEEYARAKGIISPYVVFSRDGMPYTNTGIYSAWRRGCLKAGVKGASLKDLRAKHATDAEKAGYSVEEISHGLAHTDPEMTRVYLKQRGSKVGKVALDLPK